MFTGERQSVSAFGHSTYENLFFILPFNPRLILKKMSVIDLVILGSIKYVLKHSISYKESLMLFISYSSSS